MMTPRAWWQGLGRELQAIGRTMRSWGLASGDVRLAELLGGGRPVSSGVPVSEDTALNYSAVWAAVQLIAGTVGSIPLLFYRRLPNGGKERWPEHPLARLLHDSFNPEQSSMIAREMMQNHLLLWGNAYAEIVRDGFGRVTQLWPLTPNRVQPQRASDGALIYQVYTDDGRTETLAARDMLHIPGLSFDGIVGYSVVRRMRESIGLGLATERFGATFFGSGSFVGGVLESPTALSPAAAQKLKDSWEAAHQGLSKAHRIAVLEGGITFKPTSIPPDDAQFLETRKFQITEIARWFNIPPHFLGDLDRATFSNIEHQAIQFVVYTLRPWLVRWEQEIARKLISPLERTQQAVEFLIDGLLRGDQQSRFQAWSQGINNGFLSPNDVREKENLNPLPSDQGGDLYMMPANTILRTRAIADTEAAIEAAKTGAAPAAEPVISSSDAADAPDAGAVGRQLALLGDEVRARREELTEALAAAETARNVEASALLERLEGLLAAQDQTRARLASLAVPVRTLLESTLRRELHFEADRARKAATTPEKCQAWLGPFYQDRATTALEHLLPAMRLYGVLTNRADIEAVTRAVIESEAARSRAELEAILAAAPDGLGEVVAELTERWERDRPTAIADALLGEVLTHA